MGDSLRMLILERLESGARPARFVAELADSLLWAAPRPDAFEEELAELERGGEIVVRPQYCADPHLEGTDLRLVALVRDGDAETTLRSIDAAWQEWLKGYLANHRCT